MYCNFPKKKCHKLFKISFYLYDVFTMFLEGRVKVKELVINYNEMVQVGQNIYSRIRLIGTHWAVTYCPHYLIFPINRITNTRIHLFRTMQSVFIKRFSPLCGVPNKRILLYIRYLKILIYKLLLILWNV